MSINEGSMKFTGMLTSEGTARTNMATFGANAADTGEAAVVSVLNQVDTTWTTSTNATTTITLNASNARIVLAGTIADDNDYTLIVRQGATPRNIVFPAAFTGASPASQVANSVSVYKFKGVGTTVLNQVSFTSATASATTTGAADWDGSVDTTLWLDPTANMTLNAPTNLKTGVEYTLIVSQDATARTLGFDAAYVSAGTLGTTINLYNVYKFTGTTNTTMTQANLVTNSVAGTLGTVKLIGWAPNSEPTIEVTLDDANTSLEIEGTPVDGRKYAMVVVQAGTARTLTFPTIARGVTTLGTTINRANVYSFIGVNGQLVQYNAVSNVALS